MGIALCLLVMLKLMDVRAFAASCRKDDLLSQHWRAWAGLDPGIELLVGPGILLQPELPIAARLIGATTLLLGLMGMGWGMPGMGTSLEALRSAPDVDRAFIEQMALWYRQW